MRGWIAALVLLCSSAAWADRIDDLSKSITSDPSYKVRVQAALVLGKLADKRAVPALTRALIKDQNETVRGVAAASLGRIGDPRSADDLQIALGDASDFVRKEARKALEAIANAGLKDTLPPPKPGARFFMAVGFQSGKIGADPLRAFRRALIARLEKINKVTLSVTDAPADGAEPSAQMLSQKKLTGWFVDGNIDRLSSKPAGGQLQIDCDVRGYVASYPGRAIRTMVTEGGSIQTGASPSAEIESKKDCLGAIADALGDDVEKFLKTLE